MNDPMREFVDDMLKHGKPSLAWMVRWSIDGHEPVVWAFQNSSSPWAIRDLFHLVMDHEYLTRRVEHAMHRGTIAYHHSDWVGPNVERRMQCEEIKRSIPLNCIPTLTELLQRYSKLSSKMEMEYQ